METIRESTFRCGQSWRYEFIGKLGDLRFKVHIRRGNCNEYTHGKGYVWCDQSKSWNQVIWLPVDDLRCQRFSYLAEGIENKDFNNDKEDILELMLRIVK